MQRRLRHAERGPAQHGGGARRIMSLSGTLSRVSTMVSMASLDPGCLIVLHSVCARLRSPGVLYRLLLPWLLLHPTAVAFVISFDTFPLLPLNIFFVGEERRAVHTLVHMPSPFLTV